MNTFFSIIIAIAIAFTQTISIVVVADTSSSSALRGGGRNQEQEQVQEQQRNQNHRHLLEDNSECVLYLKIISYEDGLDEESWSCEFPRIYAKEKFGGRDIMDIEGIHKEDIDAHNAVSGETIMRTTGAFVEQRSTSSLDDRATGATGDDIKLVVTDPSSIVFESLKEVDVRHHKTRSRRRLAKRNTGILKTLVVRPISPNGAVVEASAAQLRNDIFEDEICLKSQMAACSYNQVEIQPANVGDGGVVDVALDINPINDGTRNGNRGELASNAIAKTEELYGGEDGLAFVFDLVIVCQPSGSGSWDAFAYFNRYDSYYNKNRCSGSDIVMHEVGHNFGLSHSGLGDGDIYGDFTGIMGFGTTLDDAPRRCYNAVKNYRLGWYDLQIDSHDPIEYVGNPQSFVLNGVSDYKKDGSSDGELISLRLDQFGDENGVDFYLGYNRKAFPNDGASEGVDQVILYSKTNGDNGASSVRIAMLDEGQSYAIEDYRGIGSTVTITVDSISDDMKDASISISASPPPPTNAPTLPCGGVGGFKVEIGIDSFAKENNWKLFESNSNVLIEEGMAKEEYLRNQQYVEPNESSSYCLNPGSCYDFKIYDVFGDGLNPTQGGFYRGILDDTKIFEGAKFSNMDTRTFCVEDGAPSTPPVPNPTEAPTAVPTIAPTMAPVSPTIPPTTECIDDDTLRYKEVKKCQWVGLETSGRCELTWQNKLLKEFCPITCGLCEPKTTMPPTQLPTKDPTTVPTKAPSKAPTQAPTPVDTGDNGKCVDDPDYKYKNVKKCKWVKKNVEKRCNLNAKLNDGRLISDLCKVTCNTCQPTNDNNTDNDTDNDSASCASNESAFRLELLLDNYDETSWVMKRDSDGSIVGEGSEDKYKKNTEYVESLCLTNGVDYAFTIYDGYGDGLTKGSTPGHYYGILNNQEIFRGLDFGKEETKEFTVVASDDPSTPQPPTSSSCVDRSDFRYNGKDFKDCKWLGNNRKGKNRCKSKQTQDDGTKIKISDLCPSTCGVKFGIGNCN